MKAVVFVCLLSLSLCLSQPTSNQQPDAPPTLGASAKVDKEAVAKKTPEQSTLATVVSIKTLNESSPAEHITKAPAPTETATANAKPATNKTEQKETEKAVDPKSNESKSGEPAKKNETKPETPKEEMKPTNAAVPKPSEESKPTNNTTNAPVKPVTEKATETPKDTTETPMVGKRAFDGPSFIGGIILTLGLLAIGFMGFKYYKNQTERNYHTL